MFLCCGSLWVHCERFTKHFISINMINHMGFWFWSFDTVNVMTNLISHVVLSTLKSVPEQIKHKMCRW